MSIANNNKGLLLLLNGLSLTKPTIKAWYHWIWTLMWVDSDVNDADRIAAEFHVQKDNQSRASIWLRSRRLSVAFAAARIQRGSFLYRSQCGGTPLAVLIFIFFGRRPWRGLWTEHRRTRRLLTTGRGANFFRFVKGVVRNSDALLSASSVRKATTLRSRSRKGRRYRSSYKRYCLLYHGGTCASNAATGKQGGRSTGAPASARSCKQPGYPSGDVSYGSVSKRRETAAAADSGQLLLSRQVGNSRVGALRPRRCAHFFAVFSREEVGGFAWEVDGPARKVRDCLLREAESQCVWCGKALTLTDEHLVHVQQDVTSFYNHPLDRQVLANILRLAYL